jgi:hypothetical protein
MTPYCGMAMEDEDWPVMREIIQDHPYDMPLVATYPVCPQCGGDQFEEDYREP